MLDLAVVVVSWNVRELLRACLTSVYADLAVSGLAGEVWVLDNASHDGSPKVVREEFPQTHLIIQQDNLGFAGGNNAVLRQIKETTPPRHVFLLNPDTEIQPGVLRTLVDFMDAHPQAGMAGGRLLYGDGSFQHSAFSFPGLWQIAFDLFPMPAQLYESRLNGRYPRAWYERGTPFPIDHPLGATMMVRWQVIRQVGLLDDEFHMYCEEIDWCKRIKKAGWEIYCVPGAEVVHYEGQSARQIQETSFVNLWHSRWQLYNKYYSPLKHWLAKHLVRAGLKYRIRQTQKETPDPTTRSTLQAYAGAMAYFD